MTDSPATNMDQADQAAQSIQDQIDELLSQLDTDDPGSPDPMPTQAQTPAKPDPQDAAAAQTQAIAAFEQAIETPAPAPVTPVPAAPAPPDPVPADEPISSTELELQAEINALLNAEPAKTQAPAEPAASKEDLLAEEIEDLLNANAQAPATDEADNQSINDLDQMLADEIDADDELAGDFHSVQDVTAGIDTGEEENLQLEDEHAATARDVAAELDSQPENFPASARTSAAPDHDEHEDEDPFAAIMSIAEVAQTNHEAHHDQLTGNLPGWQGRLIRARNRLYHTCFTLNWPARKYLSPEWRANLGYVALLNLVGVGAIWLYVIFG